MTGDVNIYGGIGTERNEVSFESVKNQIDSQSDATELAVHIVSPGGDVFEGEAIYNLLKNSGKKITTYIEGTCASIATLIALAGDTIKMNRTGRFMVHNPKISGLNTQADARDLQHISMQLNKIKTLLIDASAKKTGLSTAKLWELYDNETWLTADEAKQMGFVDEVEDALRAVAKVDLKKMHMKDQSIWKRIQNLFSLAKFKNEFTETLADNRRIVIMSEGDDWTGAQVMLETGEMLEPGDHPLANGKVISVDEMGVIQQVTEAQPQDENQPQEEQQQESPEDMKKIEELEAKLAEALAGKQAAEAALAESKTAETTATNKAMKIENRLGQLEKEFIKLKEEAMQTVGDTTPPGDGPVIKNVGQPIVDPMAEDLGMAYITSRPNSNYARK